jgi:alcohol dehydrogenase
VATTTSAANAPWVKNLGADLVIDYRKDDFETILRHYDVVLHSQDNKTLLRALKVLKPGGTLISISGPPDPAFGAEAGAPWLVRQLIGILSSGVRREAKRRGVNYSFLFMKANGGQLGKITALIDSGVIRPVVDRTFTFEETPAALDYVETGHAKGKIVIKI